MALPVNGSTHLIPAYYSFINPERMKGWVGLVDWPVADRLPTSTLVVTHQLQVERRAGKVRQSETDVLPLCHATNFCSLTRSMKWSFGGSGAEWNVMANDQRMNTALTRPRVARPSYVVGRKGVFTPSELKLSWAELLRHNCRCNYPHSFLHRAENVKCLIESNSSWCLT